MLCIYFYLYKSVAPIKKLKFKAYPVQRWRNVVLVVSKYSVCHFESSAQDAASLADQLVNCSPQCAAECSSDILSLSSWQECSYFRHRREGETRQEDTLKTPLWQKASICLLVFLYSCLNSWLWLFWQTSQLYMLYCEEKEMGWLVGSWNGIVKGLLSEQDLIVSLVQLQETSFLWKQQWEYKPWSEW